MWFLVLFGGVCLVMLTLACQAASPSPPDRRDTSSGYFGDTASSDHVHSDHGDHGHDGGSDGGADGGSDGGGGSD